MLSRRHGDAFRTRASRTYPVLSHTLYPVIRKAANTDKLQSGERCHQWLWDVQNHTALKHQGFTVVNKRL